LASLWIGYCLSTKVKRTPSFSDSCIVAHGINCTKYHYEVIYWIRFIEESKDGFLVDEPILMKINGTIDFHRLNAGHLPNFDDYIIVNLNFLDMPKYHINDIYLKKIPLKAIRKNNTCRFLFNWTGILKFESSGPKRMYIEVIIPTQNGEKITFLRPITYIDIAPAYVATELKILKLTIILTIWIIYLTILQLLKIYNIL